MKGLQTPYFVIRKDKLQRQANDLKCALQAHFPKHTAGYSIKTNNLPWIVSFMKANGLWAEAVSSDEYNLAKSLGYTIDKIIFNGPAKGKAEFIEAVENGAIVNIDAKRELRWLKECDPQTKVGWKLGLRVNFCLEDECPGESQGGNEDGRFGFSLESGELAAAAGYLEDNGFPLSGIHLHCSSKTRSMNIYKAIAEAAVRVIRTFNLHPEYIDIGGGFFGGVPGKPTFQDYFETVKSVLGTAIDLKETTIIVEPGISLVGSSVDYVTGVIDVKATKHDRFVQLDGSRLHVDPLMRKSSYTFHIEQACRRNSQSVEQILCGFTCMENDRFFHYTGNRLAEGDIVVFERVGAYTIGFSPRFIEAYPPVYVDDGGQIGLARPKQELTI